MAGKVCQFLIFGTTFRPEFCLLKKSVFELLIEPKNIMNLLGKMITHLHNPLLCMTSTFNFHLLQLLENMKGIRILPSNLFWCSRKIMEHWLVGIDILCSQQPMQILKKEIEKLLLVGTKTKCIVYLNTTHLARKLKDEFDTYLDHDFPFEGNVILITGHVKAELKLQATNIFTALVTKASNTNTDSNPCVLLAMASSIGAGLDSDEFYHVIQFSFPPNVLNLITEMAIMDQI